MRQLKKIKGKDVVHAGSLDQVEDNYHVGNVADIPDGTPLCRVHGIPL
jgi:hypothetical protein